MVLSTKVDSCGDTGISFVNLSVSTFAKRSYASLSEFTCAIVVLIAVSEMPSFIVPLKLVIASLNNNNADAFLLTPSALISSSPNFLTFSKGLSPPNAQLTKLPMPSINPPAPATAWPPPYAAIAAPKATIASAFDVIFATSPMSASANSFNFSKGLLPGNRSNNPAMVPPTAPTAAPAPNAAKPPPSAAMPPATFAKFMPSMPSNDFNPSAKTGSDFPNMTDAAPIPSDAAATAAAKNAAPATAAGVNAVKKPAIMPPNPLPMPLPTLAILLPSPLPLSLPIPEGPFAVAPPNSLSFKTPMPFLTAIPPTINPPIFNQLIRSKAVFAPSLCASLMAVSNCSVLTSSMLMPFSLATSCLISFLRSAEFRSNLESSSCSGPAGRVISSFSTLACCVSVSATASPLRSITIPDLLVFSSLPVKSYINVANDFNALPTELKKPPNTFIFSIKVLNPSFTLLNVDLVSSQNCLKSKVLIKLATVSPALFIIGDNLSLST